MLQSFYPLQGKRHFGVWKGSPSALPPLLHYWDIEVLLKYIGEDDFLKVFNNRIFPACTLASDNSLMSGFESVNGDVSASLHAREA